MLHNNKMSFTINPCKACWQKFNNGSCDINNVNSCVVDTATAFAGIPSNNFLDTPADENWKTCVDNTMTAQGRSPCDFQLNMAPVFNQVPHYYPSLLAELGEPEKAQNFCMQKCSELRHNKKACMENCSTDHAAVESYNPMQQSNSPDENNKPISVWTGFFAILILIFIILIVYITLVK